MARRKKTRDNVVPLGTIPRRRLENSDRPAESSPVVSEPSVGGASFRRNRNLAPNLDANVVVSARVMAHDLRHRRRRIMISLAAVLGISVAIFILLTQMVFVVRVALYGQLSPLPHDEQQTYARVVRQYLGQHPLQRIYGVTSLTDLAQYFAVSGHPEIKAVTAIEPTMLGAAQVTLKAREPIASWTSDGATRYVDSEGIVFSHNYYTKPPTKIVDQSGVNTKASTGAIASSRLLQFIGLVSGEMKGYGYQIRQIDLPANTTREVDLILSSGKRVKMTIDRSVGEQSEDAERALAYFAKHHTTYRYVDVRVSREAYYR